jgi:hypothetical protein
MDGAVMTSGVGSVEMGGLAINGIIVSEGRGEARYLW